MTGMGCLVACKKILNVLNDNGSIPVGSSELTRSIYEQQTSAACNTVIPNVLALNAANLLLQISWIVTAKGLTQELLPKFSPTPHPANHNAAPPSPHITQSVTTSLDCTFTTQPPAIQDGR
jgi:hypothetical protein